ncbi:MAG: hypothetical protein EAZ92_07900 [Candidatus Kapaibacterium sp.]|nr:MAG: hypothetical protein EAZ92_07900 [Candidatus Kapabacteria bacterium]
MEMVKTFANLTGKNACATTKLIYTGFGGTDIPVCELQKHILRKSSWYQMQRDLNGQKVT